MGEREEEEDEEANSGGEGSGGGEFSGERRLDQKDCWIICWRREGRKGSVTRRRGREQERE